MIMKKRIVKKTCNYVHTVDEHGNPEIRTVTKFFVEEYDEYSKDWQIMTYFNDADDDCIRPAIFEEQKVAEAFLKGEFGILKEEIIYTE